MRFSYDAFVLNNKKDAIYYSGPFAASEKAIALNAGESYVVNGINAGGTITAAVTGGAQGDTKPTATVSGNDITIAAPAGATAGTYTVTLTANAKTTTISVVVA